MGKKIIISHSGGNANTRAAVAGMHRAGLLYKFVTSVAVFEKSWYYRFLNSGVLREFKKRTFADAYKEKVTVFPCRELGRMLSQRFKLSRLLKRETGVFSVYQVCRSIDKKTAGIIRKRHDEICAVYGYDDTALESFREAAKYGAKRFYDEPIGYWRCMRESLAKEKELHPEWAGTLHTFYDSDGKLARKDEELRLADRIYVASSFTKKSLALYPGELAEIEVIPYGFPKPNEDRAYDDISDRKIKLLYVGNLGQRKGISYLFDAVKGLEEDFELTLVGAGDVEGCAALREGLQGHNYLPPQPHDKVIEIMSRHDIFVFPSLFEGFGLVVTEAMSQGTPVITTDRTCGPDVITDGKDGWIVPAADSDAIRERLVYLSRHRDEIAKAGKEALKTAAKRPWTAYEDELAASLKKQLG